MNQHLIRENYEDYFLSDFNEYTTPLFSKPKILKFIDFIQMVDYIFVELQLHQSVSGSLHPLFSQVYVFVNNHHNHNARFGSNSLLKLPTNNTSNFEKNSFVTSRITSWDLFQSHVTGIILKEISFKNKTFSPETRIPTRERCYIYIYIYIYIYKRNNKV